MSVCPESQSLSFAIYIRTEVGGGGWKVGGVAGRWEGGWGYGGREGAVRWAEKGYTQA